ncbi:hypothetical protein T310_6235, partial [Rasamsonia emersonii CBS 393.64]
AQPAEANPVVAAALRRCQSILPAQTGHAAIGTYLQKIQAQETEASQGCQASKESVYHPLFECRQWRRQRETLYQGLTKTGIARPTMAEEYPEGRLFGNPKASRALLQFLADTAMGHPRGDHARAVDRDHRDDEWALEALEEAEREGEG